MANARSGPVPTVTYFVWVRSSPRNMPRQASFAFSRWMVFSPSDVFLEKHDILSVLFFFLSFLFPFFIPLIFLCWCLVLKHVWFHTFPASRHHTEGKKSEISNHSTHFSLCTHMSLSLFLTLTLTLFSPPFPVWWISHVSSLFTNCCDSHCLFGGVHGLSMENRNTAG